MTGTPLRIELGWPAKQLSPNSSVHHMTLHRYKKAAKTEAWAETMLALNGNRDWEPRAEKVKVHLLAHPPEAWRTGDADNFVARNKAFLDGIARALGVNDRIFDAPTVTWADRTPNGKLIVELS